MEKEVGYVQLEGNTDTIGEIRVSVYSDKLHTNIGGAYRLDIPYNYGEYVRPITLHFTDMQALDEFVKGMNIIQKGTHHYEEEHIID